MARPNKEGLDYFPLDVNCDDKVKLIEAKFGIVGFGVLIKLWQIIYENGYSLVWTEKELLLYKNRINVDINLINDVINECVKWDIFNEKLFKKHILSSSGIQKRYVGAIKRRHEITIDKDIWLIEIPESTDKLKVNVYNNSKNDDINLQSKVNRKESKEKEKYIVSQMLSMTKEEYDKLVLDYGKDNVDDKIEYSKNWGKLKDYKSLYLTINNWLRKNKKEKEYECPKQEIKTNGNGVFHI